MDFVIPVSVQFGMCPIRFPEGVERLQECLLARVIRTALTVELFQPPPQLPEFPREYDGGKALQEFFRAEFVQTPYLPGTLGLS